MKNDNKTNTYWVDLFSGAGGTSTGIHLANGDQRVLACVNHDAMAIKSHKENHPNCTHYTEDIRDFEVVVKIKAQVDAIRLEDPSCRINLWASLECTNYSKAKGGLPRDADSRTLANHLFMYIEGLDPDYIYIENVREFMSWGALDCFGKPIQKEKGKDYIKWVRKVRSFGYNYDYKLLNSADFGAYTSRIRYFGQFAKKGNKTNWPTPTHAKKLDKSTLFPSTKKKWKAVKEVLDMDDEGRCIFSRKKPLSDKTLERIYAGLVKFVANGESTFIKKYYSGDPKNKVQSIDQPAGTITTIDHHALVKANFLLGYYGNGRTHSTDLPCNTLTAKDRYGKVTLKWLMDTQYSRVGNSLQNPCFTLIARMDKKPVYFISANAVNKPVEIPASQTDTPTATKIKKFMEKHLILTISMRMLNVGELSRIQGFPKGYILKGTKTDQKKFIGNSVVPIMSKVLAEANHKTA